MKSISLWNSSLLNSLQAILLDTCLSADKRFNAKKTEPKLSGAGFGGSACLQTRPFFACFRFFCSRLSNTAGP